LVFRHPGSFFQKSALPALTLRASFWKIWGWRQNGAYCFRSCL